MKTSEIVHSLEISKIRQIALDILKYDDKIDFTIGQPGQDIPEIIKEYMSFVTINNKICYAPTGGVFELRDACAAFYNKYYGSNFKRENCLITIGATEGISTFVRYFINEGDEVIMPLPTYPGYEPNIKMCKGVPVYIDTSINNFKVTAEMIEAHITDKTKAIILTYPNNPTGQCLNEKEMDKIADLIRKHNIYLLCDEIYSTLTFDKYHSMAKYQDLIDKVVIINGFSKSHSMTGYRVGYMLASEKHISDFRKLSQYTTTGAPTVAQMGAVKALEVCPFRKEVLEENKRKLTYLKNELTKLGFEVIEPEASFYLFASYKNLSSEDSLTFCEKILKDLHIGFVPGSCFNVEGYIRISVICSDQDLKETVRRLKKYFGEIK